MYNSTDFKKREEVMLNTIDIIQTEYDNFGKYSEAIVINDSEKILDADRKGSNKVIIESIDCIECAKKLDNPVVLNMASFHNPGGGCMKGSMAQEEELFRRTTLSLSLFKYWEPYSIYYNQDYIKGAYPLLTASKCIYSGSVEVIKEGKNKDYSLLDPDDKFKMSVITIPAYRRDNIEEPYKSFEICNWREKIRTIFRVSYKYGHKNLVLSAFGCGAYNNDPSVIAGIFKDVIKEDEFKGLFDTIYFAILDKGTLVNKETNNYQVFKNILK